MVFDPTDFFETGGVIYIISASEYAPVNNNSNLATIIGYLESYFDYFDFHDAPIAVDHFDKFIDARGSNFYSL